MTFNEAKTRLDNMTEQEFDQIGFLLSKLHKKILKKDKTTADALELVLMATALYINEDK